MSTVPSDAAAWVSIVSKNLRAQINPLGAQLSTLRDSAERDLLWNGDPAVWTGRAPLLFPIVGVLAGGRYRLGSDTYALSRHGFARGKLFELIDSTLSAATFRLRADAATLEIYPFRFELDVRFQIDGATLSLTTSIRNTGDREMPASFGYHPAFRWPLPYGYARSAHFIEFDSAEPAAIRRLDSDGLLLPSPEPTPISGRRLELNDAIFREDVVILDQIRSNSVLYGAHEGPKIRVSFPDTPYLGLWTKPNADFICIEPWHGIADPKGFAGDFKTKPGVFMVPAGADVQIGMSVSLTQG